MSRKAHTDTARRRYENPEMAAGSVSSASGWGLILVSLLTLWAVPTWRAAEGDALPVASLLEGWDRGRAAPNLLAANHELLAAIDRFETHLEDTSPVLEALLPSVQSWQLRFGGKGNETVYPGAEGWLLLRAGFDHLVGPPFLDPAALERRRRGGDSWRPEPQPDPRPALFDLQRQLRERGVDLMLLPVPTKPAIEAQSVAPDIVRPLANPSQTEFVRQMDAEGIHVVDIAATLNELTHSGTAAYLRTDSHWSPAAVSKVAASLAARLESAYGQELGPDDAFWQATPTRRAGRGDLWRLLRLSGERALFDEESVMADEITSWEGELWRPSRDASILVLGDSFVNVYSDESLHWGRAAGFAEQLSFHLQRPVDRLARNAGASDQVRRDLARSPDRLDSKRVVIYLFASRELSLGDWPVVEIAAGR
ncbi:MAG: hypothetical protein MPN21_00070 [Thermoanaerobaculia bacterium]|nr:hypothetical protein [Thermoanaerobaculia bacterium]